AVIPGTTDPQTMLEGDGKAILYGLVQPWVSRARSSAQTIPSGNTWVTIGFNVNVDSSTGSGISYSSGVFTVSQAGVYEVSAQATITPTAGTTYGFRMGARLLVNGNDSPPLALNGQHVSTGSYSSTGVWGKKVRLAVGDTI